MSNTIIYTTEDLEALPRRTIIEDAKKDEWLVKPTRSLQDQDLDDERIFFHSLWNGANYRANRVPLPARVIQFGQENT